MSDFGNKSRKQEVFIPGFLKKIYRPVGKCIRSWVLRAKVLEKTKLKVETIEILLGHSSASATLYPDHFVLCPSLSSQY